MKAHSCPFSPSCYVVLLHISLSLCRLFQFLYIYYFSSFLYLSYSIICRFFLLDLLSLSISLLFVAIAHEMLPTNTANFHSLTQFDRRILQLCAQCSLCSLALSLSLSFSSMLSRNSRFLGTHSQTDAHSDVT